MPPPAPSVHSRIARLLPRRAPNGERRMRPLPPRIIADRFVPRTSPATAAAIVIVLGTSLAAGNAGAREPIDFPSPFDTVSVPILTGAMVHFHADSAGRYAPEGFTAEDGGRIVRTAAMLPEPHLPCRVHALITLRPTPKNDREVWDRWDRAGNIRLVAEGTPDLEIVRFVTSYGGRTEHEVDVSDLAPLLTGRRDIRAFIDTWTSPGWRVDFSLRYEPDTTYDAPAWVLPVLYTDSFNRRDNGGGMETRVEVPQGLARTVLRYFSTGHCTDGRDEDEFVSKANVISVDGVAVARVHPWRDDCRRFRDRNPYCARWTDGSWSSDYSRSGWCPGVEVLPMEFDLSDHLTPGPHTI
ncbi:MAG: hypothetical protein FJY88_00835, partial [Candidatus Eisenbacteria bacterium]|nr:hypothetical protein [Candidatus Eisenbacteria bacterium]